MVKSLAFGWAYPITILRSSISRSQIERGIAVSAVQVQAGCLPHKLLDSSFRSTEHVNGKLNWLGILKFLWYRRPEGVTKGPRMPTG
jgi:hypothetical protein